jgi:hypothetical protein
MDIPASMGRSMTARYFLATAWYDFPTVVPRNRAPQRISKLAKREACSCAVYTHKNPVCLVQ